MEGDTEEQKIYARDKLTDSECRQSEMVDRCVPACRSLPLPSFVYNGERLCKAYWYVLYSTYNWLHSYVIPASQNEVLVKVLKLGMLLPTIISILLRLLFRRGSWPPSILLLVFYIIASAPAALLSLYLINIGTPKREPTTNTLIFYGEDLSQPGVTEWCFDIIYITCATIFTPSLDSN